MSSFLNTRTLVAGAATALFVGLAMTASAQASTTSKLAQCSGSSRSGAVSCCQEVVSQFGAPSWLGGRTNCNRAITCGNWGKKTYCYIVANKINIKDNNGGGGNNTHTPGVNNNPKP